MNHYVVTRYMHLIYANLNYILKAKPLFFPHFLSSSSSPSSTRPQFGKREVNITIKEKPKNELEAFSGDFVLKNSK